MLIALAPLLMVVSALNGSWLTCGVGGLMLASGILTLRDLRRQGVDRHGPVTFRELRERQAATRPPRRGPGP